MTVPMLITLFCALLILLVMCIIIFDKRMVISREWNMSNFVISLGIVSLYSMASSTVSHLFFVIILFIFGGIGVIETNSDLSKLAQSENQQEVEP